MTQVKLLHDLKDFIVSATEDILLPTALQKGDTERVIRSPEVHLMRLPDSSDAKKKAPYIIVQMCKSLDRQQDGQNSDATAVIRIIYCVYCANEEEGALMLLNLMETVRISLLKKVVVGEQFKLDTTSGFESLIYTDDTAPYYAGESMCTFELPAIEREVNYG